MLSNNSRNKPTEIFTTDNSRIITDNYADEEDELIHDIVKNFSEDKDISKKDEESL